MNLQFKFRTDASPDERHKVVARLHGSGADVEKIFPDETDENLAAMYSAHVDDGRRFSTLLRWLQTAGAVDYAEPEPDRAIYMPQEMSPPHDRRRR